MRFHKSRKRYFFFQRIGSKIILAKERGKICTRYVSLPPRSFNLDSFAMPLSFRWNQNRGFYRPVSLFSSSLPFSPPRPFFPPTRGTKTRTNQYSPTYLPRDHNLQKRNPWKNGSVPSFPQFRSPERTKPLPRQRERESNGTRRVSNEKRQRELVRLFHFVRTKVFRAKNLHAFPSRLEKVSCCGALLTDLFRFRTSSPPKQPELS